MTKFSTRRGEWKAQATTGRAADCVLESAMAGRAVKDEIVREIGRDVERRLSRSRGSHDWEHTQRVLKLSLRLGRICGADRRVLTLAALLHDIGRERQDRSKGAVCHAASGAITAARMLRRRRLEEETVAAVVHCIECHRFRGRKRPLSLEARILYDADKLDAIGAVGIGRAFLFAGEVGAALHRRRTRPAKTRAYTRDDTAYREFLVKLRKLKGRMLTTEGKRVAEGRHRFMADFFRRLNMEIDGIV